MKTRSSPESASTAGMSRCRSGHVSSSSRPATAPRRTDSSMVWVANARAPIRCRISCAEPAPVAASVSRAINDSASTSTSISLDVSENWRAYRSARSVPPAIWAATVDPADVPTIRSASTTAGDKSATTSRIPSNTPSSQAMPATPPPASTSARCTMVFSFDLIFEHRHPTGGSEIPVGADGGCRISTQRSSERSTDARSAQRCPSRRTACHGAGSVRRHAAR